MTGSPGRCGDGRAIGGLVLGEGRDLERDRGLWLQRRVPVHLQFDGLAVEVEWQRGADGEFFGALQGAVCERLEESGVVEEIGGEFGVDEDPASAVEAVAVVIDLKDRRGQLASILDAPGERVEAGVDGAGGSATMVEIDRAETDHGAEGTLPWKCWKLYGQLRIRLELQACQSRECPDTGRSSADG